uniref:Ribosomal protein L20 n=1 Tax=Sarcopeltis skottsbergii TaxID=2765380 RepID=A0A7M1VHT3_SARSK|nr:ribosomal protein L20 [Sarcopeltis skottsbergii]QOS04479.1 ribosomal protein L20 [Sarcopeltis skottsbergii]
MKTQLKNELFQTYSRKTKKRTLQQTFLKQINFTMNVKYHFLCYFNSNEKILLNRKILSSLFAKESGSFFSWKKWVCYFEKKLY